jgi:3-dehydroquinate synthase
MSTPERIVLIGFSGTGKSAVGPVLAGKLGWEFVDTDEYIERREGRRILEIFREKGEEHFRELETAALKELCARGRLVIATGGGIILRPENRRMLADGGFIVCLEARPETILRRLTERSRAAPLDRPLLATGNPLTRIRELKESRQHLYALADWSVHTETLSAEQVADEIVRAWQSYGPLLLADARRLDEIASEAATAPRTTLHAVPPGAAATVATETGDYPIFVGWGLLGELGGRLREAGLARHAYVITDEEVAHHYEDEISAALSAADIPFDVLVLPPGEATKTLRTAAEVYDWLVERRAERSHTVIGFGGGVMTDLAGFVAATFARGLPLVHVPTSLLGMVDAAIGGKVAVNHPKAKNMIGAFYQPRMVLADPALLRTLSPRETSGWAEAIKHAMIADESYLRFFEENAERILRLDREAVTEAIRRSVVIKAEIVSQDEREESGVRSFLNYGHTLAHAIESTTGYKRFRHGEADGVGMMAAAHISRLMDLLPEEVVERQRAVLERFGLPTRASGLDRDLLKAAIALDKKVQGRTVRWVLLEGIGRPVLRSDVPPEVVDEAIALVTG